MILPIYVYGQPVLREEAQDITPDYPNLKELIANMFETMDRADGVGTVVFLQLFSQSAVFDVFCTLYKCTDYTV